MKKGYLRIMMFALFLPYIANTFGWMLAEFGRQPWLVYGLQTLEQGISPNVPASSIAISLAGFVIIYSALMVVDVFLLLKNAKKSPEDLEPAPQKEGSLWI
jgi:cytochrome d ubiquinol oxidase subunit I